MAITTLPARASARTRTGIGWALASAATFGLSGSLAASLLAIGWSPAAVVVARVGGAFLVLVVPCVLLLSRTGWPTAAETRRLVAYGVVAVAFAQFCYFNAVSYLSVGVALLLEYLAPVLLIGWHWWRTKVPPTRAVLGGAAVAMVGMTLVLDVFGGVRLHPLGVLWGLGAAVGLCAYFVLSDHGRGASSPPLLVTTAGTGVGAAVLLAAGIVGLVPLTAQLGVTRLAGAALPWWLPLLLIVLVSAVFAYLSGIVAVRQLGSSLASFVSLTEVLFAVLFAAVLLGQRPGPTQLVGGVLVLGGIALIQRASAAR